MLNKSWFHSIRVRVAKLDFSKVSRVQNPLSFRHTGYLVGCPRKFQIWIVLTTYIYQPSLLTTIRFYPQISWWFSKPCTVVPHSWHSWCSNNSNNLGLWYIIYICIYIYIYLHTLSMKKRFFFRNPTFFQVLYIYISFYLSIYIYIYISLWVINQSYNWRAPPWLPRHPMTLSSTNCGFSSHLLSRVVQFLQCGGCPGKITSRCPGYDLLEATPGPFI